MAIKKKGQLFSMIALLMSLFFIILFSGVTRVPLDGDVDNTRSQVLYLNEVVLDFPTLIDSAAQSSTLLILNFSVSHLNGTNYFPDFENFFDSCFINGSFYDYADSTVKPCSNSNANVSFSYIANEIFYLTAEVYNMDISLSNLSHRVSLYDAYSLEIALDILVDAKLRSSKKNIAWKRSIDISSQVDFAGITDPASIGTNFVRKIRYAPNERTFARVGFMGDERVVSDYIDNTYYYVDQTAPSFIDRMEGRQTQTFDLVDSNTFGIATFIPAYNQSGDSLYVEDVSMVDHHYDWGATPDPSLLRFFEVSSTINRNITLYRTYALQGLGFNESDLVLVVGNCNALGCSYP